MTADSGPFSTIEGAQEFLALLGEATVEALDEANRELDRCVTRQRHRRVAAWRLVVYKTSSLASAVDQSRRLLEELRMLRDALQHPGRSLPESVPARSEPMGREGAPEAPSGARQQGEAA